MLAVLLGFVLPPAGLLWEGDHVVYWLGFIAYKVSIQKYELCPLSSHFPSGSY